MIKKWMLLAWLCLGVLSVSAQSSDRVRLEKVAEGFNRPIYLTHAPDDPRLFVVEQGGRIFTLQDGQKQAFLNVTDLLSSDVNGGGYTERGLLGLAFHPDYAENGLFYVNHTDRGGNTVVAEYAVRDGIADPATRRILLQVPQPFPNHNGGHIAFGQDGYLYISLGDGGAANDPLGAGQNLMMLLGKLLRVDVNAPEGYLIPPDNPFVAGGGAPEIWAYGLRNVWRFSFDRETGDLYMGDVGQNQYEEVNFQPADSAGGENYGWNAYEASTVFNRNVRAQNAVMPVAEYQHSNANGCSITGGYVYRGEAIPALQGIYLYSDYCSGRVWYLFRDANGGWQNGVFADYRFGVSSFGEDADGELYILDYRGGSVYKLVPRS